MPVDLGDQAALSGVRRTLYVKVLVVLAGGSYIVAVARGAWVVLRICVVDIRLARLLAGAEHGRQRVLHQRFRSNTGDVCALCAVDRGCCEKSVSPGFDQDIEDVMGETRTNRR